MAATEAARRSTGTVVRRELSAAPAMIDLGGKVVPTWAYDGTVPGPQISLTAGDRLQVRLSNQLTAPTTVHWHGLAVRNDMDGVPDLTMKPVAPGAGFDYNFIVPDPGTYWFHPHVGTQLDTGLQAALVVADPNEPGAYDEEVVLVLDDWTDGLGDSPAAILDRMRAGHADGRDGRDEHERAAVAERAAGDGHRRRQISGAPDQRQAAHRARHDHQCAGQANPVPVDQRR